MPSPRGAVLVGTERGGRVWALPPPTAFFLVSSWALGGFGPCWAATRIQVPPHWLRDRRPGLLAPPLPPSSFGSSPQEPAAAARSGPIHAPNGPHPTAVARGAGAGGASARTTGRGRAHDASAAAVAAAVGCVCASSLGWWLVVPCRCNAVPRHDCARPTPPRRARTSRLRWIFFSFVFCRSVFLFFFPPRRDTLRFRRPPVVAPPSPPSCTFSWRPVGATVTVRHIDGGDCAATHCLGRGRPRSAPRHPASPA